MRRKKFAIQIETELLKEMRALARSEGRPLQALVEEAFADYVERRYQQHPRPHVMAVYETSHERYSSVYKKLAK